MGAYIKVIIVVAVLLWLLLFSGMVGASASARAGSDDRSLAEYLYPIITAGIWVEPKDIPGAGKVTPSHITMQTAEAIYEHVTQLHNSLHPSGSLSDVNVYYLIDNTSIIGYAIGATILAGYDNVPDGRLRVFYTVHGKPVNMGWIYLYE